ncbi:AAA family ATPase [Komagataeibacter oboediens]|uniref:ATP-binding protein n=1 Tax=Komagataeibacter oboediens TaxID=65958 RepID=A0ABS5SMH8_9PROT|nr:AAA family ATPase [Komagataeibacter oboediens]MBL7233148.1 ATP-binding protein [Komagataeibacter oboediens]MBT0675432.1 ATP-binding protein [Komagataeibacter oboediens]MBT0679679.1 ATP-binding protein [Komagataeibacter oboediens]
MLEVLARNYRGFKDIRERINKVIFLVGDNSSGKSSFSYLVNYIINSELRFNPHLDTMSHSEEYDFFSPFFDYNDVTIGFKLCKGEDIYFKFITIKKPRIYEKPKISKATFIHNKDAYVLKNVSGHANIKYLKNKEKIENIDDAYIIHDLNSGFKKTSVKLGGMNVNDNNIVVESLFDLDSKKDYAKKFIISFGSTILDNFRLISPLRANPSVYYEYNSRIEKTGEHFASMMYRMFNNPRTKKEGRFIINKFGKESGLFEDVNVERMSKNVEDSPIVLSVERNGNNFMLPQLGFGVSQSLPIITECALSIVLKRSNMSFGIQQPELHLHPKAQAAFGDFIFYCASKDLGMIIETHSDFIIDRFKIALRDSEKKVESRILFFQSTEKENKIHNIEISEDGCLGTYPDAYRDFFIKEYIKTI